MSLGSLNKGSNCEGKILAYKKNKLCLISILYVKNTNEECFIGIYIITKSMRALSLVNQLWVIVKSINQLWVIVENSWKIRASSELLYKSNRPQVTMGYRLINYAGCWKNT